MVGYLLRKLYNSIDGRSVENLRVLLLHHFQGAVRKLL